MTSVIANKSENLDDMVDREKKCPLLLRVFINVNSRHYHLNEYNRGNVPSKEVQIYTWMDATLKELTSLVKEVNQDCRKPGTRFDFALVFPDMRTANYRMREIGFTINGRKESDDLKTLAQSRFQIGDYLDVAINFPSMMGKSNDGSGSRSGIHHGGSSARGSGMRFNGDRDYGGRDRDFGSGRDRDFGGGRDRDFGRDRGRPY
ncbi:hypothetical protein RDWZM_001274 [Blomia tropicalis]|uniref:18 kDa Sin3-associated polypeptide n=1 Tax=Blomia tropicalis TaxID=40697 RepID=A0A9Q0RQE4_BLOTA|nr:hypothetical protein RDWZM_001274 [Blomia tropicalis]